MAEHDKLTKRAALAASEFAPDVVLGDFMRVLAPLFAAARKEAREGAITEAATAIVSDLAPVEPSGEAATIKDLAVHNGKVSNIGRIQAFEAVVQLSEHYADNPDPFHRLREKAIRTVLPNPLGARSKPKEPAWCYACERNVGDDEPCTATSSEQHVRAGDGPTR